MWKLLSPLNMKNRLQKQGIGGTALLQSIGSGSQKPIWEGPDHVGGCASANGFLPNGTRKVIKIGRLYDRQNELDSNIRCVHRSLTNCLCFDQANSVATPLTTSRKVGETPRGRR